MARPDDLKLAESIRQGDKQALHAIVLKTKEKIAVVVRRRLGAENPEWRDVVQEVLLAVLESLKDGQFDPQKGTSLQSYIYGITLNKIRDYFKSSTREKRMTNISEIAHLLTEEDSKIEKEEMRHTLRGSISNLKEKYQVVDFGRSDGGGAFWGYFQSLGPAAG